MNKPNLYRGKKPVRVKFETVVELARLLQETGYATEFSQLYGHLDLGIEADVDLLLGDDVNQNSSNARVSVEKLIKALTLHTQSRTKRKNRGVESEAKLTLAPEVVNAAKVFLSEKGIDQRNAFARSITGMRQSDCNPPYECPHIPQG
jgi:hypothetical protein